MFIVYIYTLYIVVVNGAQYSTIIRLRVITLQFLNNSAAEMQLQMHELRLVWAYSNLFSLIHLRL